MICPKCRAENRLGAKFCGECGHRFAAACPACGAVLQTGYKFCDSCGTLLETPAPAVARFASPRLYTPQHLAQKILSEKGVLEGERKQVTVLFADIRGSMELLADRDPEDARRILDPVVERMMEAVHRYEGTVNQVMGDGIMALFGAPLAHEDHAVRACHAALRMQESVGRYAEELRRTQGIDVLIRVGLNSGEVVVRAIDNDLHMDYSAVGQTTHLAARMEQTATPGTIQLTEASVRLAEGFIEVASRGPLAVKGLAAPIEVFQLVGTGYARRRLQVTAARGLTPFVGRDFELDTLSKALEQARQGRGRTVAISGEPGVGKSRLFWEFTHSHHTEGCLVLEAISVSYGKATPYLPVIDLLKTYFRFDERDGTDEAGHKIQDRLSTLGLAHFTDLAALRALFNLPVTDPQWQTLDPPHRRQRTLQAIQRLFVRESQLQPVVLIFEDLHWVDSETQALLESLRGGIPATRILLLVNYRPEYQPGWSARSGFVELGIEPLETASAEECVSAVLGSDPSVEPLRSILLARAEGNPFFLEESVRSLSESGVLEGATGRYRLVRPLTAIQVPATIQAIIAARMDRLPPEEKRLVQCASAIGKFVPVPLLELVAEMPDEVLQRGLAHLQSADFLFSSSLYPEIEYSFKHALTYEVAYTSLLHGQRRALHLRIVEALEKLTGEGTNDRVEQLAHHAFRAEAWEKALAYCRRSGERAAARPAPREAAAYFEQALAAGARLPESRETIEVAIDLRFELRNALFALGELERIDGYLGEAAALAEGIGDQRRLGWVAAYRSHYYLRVGDEASALDQARRAVELGEGSGDFDLQTTRVLLGLAYYAAGEFASANACLRRIVAELEGDRAHRRFGWAAYPAVTGRAYLAASLTEVGEFAEAVRHARDALAIAEELDHAFSLGQAYIGMGLVRLGQGAFRAAVEVFEAGLRLCERRDVEGLVPGTSAGLGYALAMSGDHDRGLPLLERAVKQGAARRLGVRHSQWTTWLAETLLAAGRPAEALATATKAMQDIRRLQARGGEAWGLRLMGLIHEQNKAGDHEAAASYQQSIELAEALGMAPLAARGRLALGALQRRIGLPELARPTLLVAVEAFAALGMAGPRDRARAELAATSASGEQRPWR